MSFKFYESFKFYGIKIYTSYISYMKYVPMLSYKRYIPLFSYMKYIWNITQKIKLGDF